MKKTLIATIITIGLIGVNTCVYATKEMPNMNNMHDVTTLPGYKAAISLDKTMRNLWADYVIYTRDYIVSSLNDLPNSDAVYKKLLKNQDDIAKAIKPYYGDKGEKKLAKLLHDQTIIMTDLVKAAKQGNDNLIHEAQQKWNKNADAIANFLNETNPNWKKKDLTDMLYKYIDLTTNEVTSFLKKNWEDNINFYDKVRAQILNFADTLADGIVKQFPEKFSKK